MLGPNGGGLNLLKLTISREKKAGQERPRWKAAGALIAQETAKQMAVVTQFNQHSWLYSLIVLLGELPTSLLQKEKERELCPRSSNSVKVDMLEKKTRLFVSFRWGETAVLLARLGAEPTFSLLWMRTYQSPEYQKYQLSIWPLWRISRCRCSSCLHDIQHLCYSDYLYLMKNRTKGLQRETITSRAGFVHTGSKSQVTWAGISKLWFTIYKMKRKIR